MARDTIAIKFAADTSAMRKGIDQVNGQLKGFAKAAIGIGAGLAAAFAGREMLEFGKDAVLAAEAANTANAKLTQIGESMGRSSQAANELTDSLSVQAKELSKLVAVQDEEIKQGQAILLTFGNVGASAGELGGVFDRAQKAALDLSATGFGSVQSASTMLGKALEDPAKGLTALTRVGVSFTAAEKDKIKALQESGDMLGAQEILLKAVEKQVGGVAEATADASDKLKIAFGEMQEAFGQGLVPLLDGLAETLLPVMEGLEEPMKNLGQTLSEQLGPVITELAGVLPTVAKAFGTLATVVSGVLTTAIKTMAPILSALVDLFAQFAARVLPLVMPLIQRLGELLGRAANALLPLVDAFLDLVASLLEGLTPILDVAIELLLVLVDVLTPIIAAVSQVVKAFAPLLVAFGQLLSDILTPLIPVITLTTKVLGELLVKALGLLSIAIGYGIKAWGQWATTLAGIVGPTVEKVLGFLADLMEGMAFLPFVGDDFAAAASGLRNSAGSITSSVTKFTSTLSSTGDAVISAGKDILAGTSSLAEETQDSFLDVFAPSEPTKTAIMAENEETGAAAVKAAGKGAKKAAKEEKSQIAESIKEMLKESEKVFQDWRNKVVGWMNIGSAFDQANNAQDRLAELNKQLGELRADPEFNKETERKLLEQIDEAGRDAGRTWLDRFTAQIGDGVEFARLLGDLKNSGLNQSLIDQVAGMGPGAGMELAYEIVNNPDGGLVATLNAQASIIEQAGADLGLTMVNAAAPSGKDYAMSFMYGETKDGTLGLIPVIETNKKKVRKAIRDALNTEVTVTVKYVADYSQAGPAHGGGGAVRQIQQYEALNGTSWRV